MHNLGNKKALQRILGGIKGLWIANTRSINTEQNRIRGWENKSTMPVMLLKVMVY